jgi:hypothetical protein
LTPARQALADQIDKVAATVEEAGGSTVPGWLIVERLTADPEGRKALAALQGELLAEAVGDVFRAVADALQPKETT